MSYGGYSRDTFFAEIIMCLVEVCDGTFRPYYIVPDGKVGHRIARCAVRTRRSGTSLPRTCATARPQLAKTDTAFQGLPLTKVEETAKRCSSLSTFQVPLIFLPITTFSFRRLNWITAKEVAVLNGHTDSVSSAAFSGDGKRVVTASYDKDL
jgi:WD40 repeat protein